MHADALARIATVVEAHAAALRAAVARGSIDADDEAHRLVNRLGDDLEGLEAALVLSPREWDRDSEPRCDDTSPWWTSDVAGKSWLRALPQFGGALRVGLVGLGLVPLLLGVLLCFFPDCLHRVRSGWGR